MVTYLSTKHTLEHPDIGEYQTCSILALNDGEIVDGVLDVSLIAEEAEQMADKLNTYEVPLMHLKDVIQNMVEDMMTP